MVDCVPILARSKAHPLSHRHEPPTPLLARPAPAPSHFPGLTITSPPLSSGTLRGMATRRALIGPSKLEGGALSRELGVKYSLEERACSATYHPPWYPTSHSPTRARNPAGCLDLRRRRLARAGGAPRGFRSRGPSRGAEEAGQVPPGVRSGRRLQHLLPIAIETFGGLGPGVQSFIKTLLRLRSARLSHIDSDDYDAPRVGHYYTQRLVVSSLRARPTWLRRKAVWESQARDMSLQPELEASSRLREET